LGFSQTSTTAGVRWIEGMYEALETRLVLTRQTTDEAIGMLVWRFPAIR
jgi:hypothetical protein